RPEQFGSSLANPASAIQKGASDRAFSVSVQHYRHAICRERPFRLAGAYRGLRELATAQLLRHLIRQLAEVRRLKAHHGFYLACLRSVRWRPVLHTARLFTDLAWS